MKKQLKFDGDQKDISASKAAIEMSKSGKGYACIVSSNGNLFVEDEAPLVRMWETLVAEYEDGELITQ